MINLIETADGLRLDIFDYGEGKPSTWFLDGHSAFGSSNSGLPSFPLRKLFLGGVLQLSIPGVAGWPCPRETRPGLRTDCHLGLTEKLADVVHGWDPGAELDPDAVELGRANLSAFEDENDGMRRLVSLERDEWIL